MVFSLSEESRIRQEGQATTGGDNYDENIGLKEGKKYGGCRLNQ